MEKSLGRRLGAEFVGTFTLVFGGCGAAVLAGKFLSDSEPGKGVQLGIGFLGVALAFGLTVVTMAYALAHISGAHFNPAVTVGVWLGKRFPGKDVLPYVVVQVIAGIIAAGVLLLIAKGAPGGYDAAEKGLAANGYAAHSPGHYTLAAAAIIEVVCTILFVLVIMGATHARAPKGLAALAIGFALTLVHLISIPVTNTSVNPARSTGPAVFVGGWALSQLWLFWLAPLIGGAVAGACYRFMAPDEEAPLTETAA
ncbi:MAG: aquaporin Z [Acidimicrobiia bacterium]